MKPMKNINAWVVIGALLAPAAAFAADITTVTVEGEAAIVDGDPSLTEKNVKKAARRLAIEQGAGISVDSTTFVPNSSWWRTKW